MKKMMMKIGKDSKKAPMKGKKKEQKVMPKGKKTMSSKDKLEKMNAKW